MEQDKQYTHNVTSRRIRETTVLFVHAMETCGGIELELHAFLISLTERDEWLVLHPAELLLANQRPLRQPGGRDSCKAGLVVQLVTQSVHRLSYYGSLNSTTSQPRRFVSW